MRGLNLHEIAGNALDFINPWRELVFTKKRVVWLPTARKPQEITESVTVQGKLQPANLQTLGEMGYALQEYQYFRVYLSLNATQLDQIRQLGSDTFTTDGETYRITDKSDWIQNGWREAYCYLDKVEDISTDKTYVAGEPLNLGNAEADGVILSSSGLEYGLDVGHEPIDTKSAIDVYNNSLRLLKLPDNTNHQKYEIIATSPDLGQYKIEFKEPIWLDSVTLRLYSTNADCMIYFQDIEDNFEVEQPQGNFWGNPVTVEYGKVLKSIVFELGAVDGINSYISGFKLNARKAVLQ